MDEWNQIPVVGDEDFDDLVDDETLVDDPNVEELE
jgi:hypothetical protein